MGWLVKRQGQQMRSDSQLQDRCGEKVLGRGPLTHSDGRGAAPGNERRGRGGGAQACRVETCWGKAGGAGVAS